MSPKQWRIQGRGAPLVLDQTEARGAEKMFLESSPLLSKGLDDRPAPIKPKLLYESVPIFKLCNLYHGENSTRIGTVEPPVNLTPTNSTQILLSCRPSFLKEVTRSCQVHKNLSWPIITLTLITSLADYTLIFVGELRCRSL